MNSCPTAIARSNSHNLSDATESPATCVCGSQLDHNRLGNLTRIIGFFFVGATRFFVRLCLFLTTSSTSATRAPANETANDSKARHPTNDGSGNDGCFVVTLIAADVVVGATRIAIRGVVIAVVTIRITRVGLVLGRSRQGSFGESTRDSIVSQRVGIDKDGGIVASIGTDGTEILSSISRSATGSHAHVLRKTLVIVVDERGCRSKDAAGTALLRPDAIGSAFSKKGIAHGATDSEIIVDTASFVHGIELKGPTGRSRGSAKVGIAITIRAASNMDLVEHIHNGNLRGEFGVGHALRTRTCSVETLHAIEDLSRGTILTTSARAVGFLQDADIAVQTSSWKDELKDHGSHHHQQNRKLEKAMGSVSSSPKDRSAISS